MKMTDEQRELVEKNVDFVHFYLNIYHLEEDKYLDVLLEELCRAAMKYDVTQGYTFTTFASKYFYNRMSQYIGKKNRTKFNVYRQRNICSLDRELSDDDDAGTIHDVLADDRPTPEDEVMNDQGIDLIYSCCNDDMDRRILFLLSDAEYTKSDVAKIIGMSRQALYSRLKRIGERYLSKIET